MADDLQSLIESAAATHGLDLEEAAVHGSGPQRVLKVVVDADGGASIDAIAKLSRQIARELDETGLMGEQKYTLEVTSRGVSSPLTLLRHWQRNVGRLVRVTPVEGKAVTGRIVAVGDDGATLDVSGGHTEVGFADVAKAVIQVELKKN